MVPKRHYIAFAAFSFFILVIVFHQNFFGGKHFFATDITTQNLPDRVYFAENLREGKLPLWTQGIFCGYPLYAEGQSGVFYPLFLLFVLVKNSSLAYDLFVLLHYWIGAICFYLYLRIRLFDHWPSAFSAISLMFSAYFLSFHIYPNHLSALVWIPLYLATFEMYAGNPSKKWVGAGALVLTLQLLAGHPQFAPMGIFIGAVLSTRIWKTYFRFVLMTAGIAFLAASIQLIPHLEFLFNSERGHGLKPAEVTVFSSYPKLFMQLILPRYFGSLGDQSFWAPNASPEENLLLYIGFAFLLALVGIFRYWRDSLSEIALVLIGIFLALGSYAPYITALYSFRPFSFFRFPSRFGYMIIFGLLVIAARELNFAFSDFSAKKARMMGIVCILIAIASEVLCGGCLPPVAWELAPSRLALKLGPMERFSSRFDAMIPDRINDQIRPLSHKYELFKQIYGGDQNLLSPYWHARGIYHSLVPANFFNRFSYATLTIDNPEFLSLTNTVMLVSLEQHDNAIWRLESKIGNVWIYRRQTPGKGAVYVSYPENSAAATPCRILETDDESMHFHCSTAQPGNVFVAMNNYPGWQAYVNGTKVSLETAEGFAISIPVPAGENDVALRFNSWTFPLGVFLTFGGLLLLLRLFFH